MGSLSGSHTGLLCNGGMLIKERDGVMMEMSSTELVSCKHGHQAEQKMSGSPEHKLDKVKQVGFRKN
jgi:hypothetical protein